MDRVLPGIRGRDWLRRAIGSWWLRRVIVRGHRVLICQRTEKQAFACIGGVPRRQGRNAAKRCRAALERELREELESRRELSTEDCNRYPMSTPKVCAVELHFFLVRNCRADREPHLSRACAGRSALRSTPRAFCSGPRSSTPHRLRGAGLSRSRETQTTKSKSEKQLPHPGLAGSRELRVGHAVMRAKCPRYFFSGARARLRQPAGKATVASSKTSANLPPRPEERTCPRRWLRCRASRSDAPVHAAPADAAARSGSA